MPQVEYKSIPLNLKDVDTSKRTAVIAHSAYNNIDRGEDRANKGMFTKSWNEGVDEISLYFNHDDTQAPGKVMGAHEDNEFAYTETKMGTHTLGNDVLLMMQDGIIKKASFGFIPVVAPIINIKSRKIRDLKEVKHIETSLLTKLPMNNKTKIVSVKSLSSLDIELKTLTPVEQTFLAKIISIGSSNIRMALDMADTLSPDSDLYTYVNYYISRQSDAIADAKCSLRYGSKADDATLTEMKAHVLDLERFVHNSKASDDCIQQVQADLTETKSILALYDTADTSDGKPVASAESNQDDLLIKLLTLKQKVS